MAKKSRKKESKNETKSWGTKILGVLSGTALIVFCICLILAMVITILPSEVKAQGKKTWGEAYEEVLKQYSSDLKAKLIYLDNDNIPEVYVDLNNGKVVLLSYDLRVKTTS